MSNIPSGSYPAGFASSQPPWSRGQSPLSIPSGSVPAPRNSAGPTAFHTSTSHGSVPSVHPSSSHDTLIDHSSNSFVPDVPPHVQVPSNSPVHVSPDVDRTVRPPSRSVSRTPIPVPVFPLRPSPIPHTPVQPRNASNPATNFNTFSVPPPPPVSLNQSFVHPSSSLPNFSASPSVSLPNSLPTVSHIPILKGPDNWALWYDSVWSTLAALHLIPHVCEAPPQGVPFTIFNTPSYPPVSPHVADSQSWSLYLTWWREDVFAAHVLTARLTQNILAFLPDHHD
ncbi:hypothetical protein K435DRAFT_855341 [Dendrothele bispora CBS 962.96]|uniref:Uncharacterized protein n=1 Tax=Dendrothele bispora (strain CBS 962.96) TaxID=1314807 RepID=A0A4S8MC07_DENBC|nr:hypothetical protein K435DRAFT_855341 [Dendrothele bispora CBS 962.96]